MSQAQDSGGLSRRRFLQGVGGAAGAAAVASAVPGGGLIQPTEAIPSTPIGTSTGAGGYLTRAVNDITGGDTVEPGSSTPEAIAESWYRTGMYAREHDEWALQMLWNRLEDARTIANVKAKGVAIQAIENGESESFVLEAAKDEIDQYYAMIQTNLANHYKAQCSKYETAAEEVKNHSDISEPDQFVSLRYDGTTGTVSWNKRVVPIVQSTNATLVDDSTMEIPEFTTGSFDHGDMVNCKVEFSMLGTSTVHADDNAEVWMSIRIPSTVLSGVDTSTSVSFAANWDVLNPTFDPETVQDEIDAGDTSWDRSYYDRFEMYGILWNRVENQHSQMVDNIETWVSNAYGSVQSGEIDVQDLVNNNPTVMASEWSTRYEQTGHLAYAAADLAALGLSFDSDRRMGFELDDGTTFDGTLYVSDDEFEINVGEIVEPSATGANFYAAADTATMERFLADDEFREGVDGGQIKLNVGVVKETEYVVQTTNGETVTLAWDDWSIPDGSDAAVIEEAESVVYDASGDLDTAVTSVESVLHRYASSESATVLELTDPFKITEAYDVETGEEADVVSGQGYNAGTTEVDLSWIDDYLERRENVDDYAEDSGDDGGGGGGPDWDWWADWLNDLGLDGIIPRTIFGVPTWLVLVTGGAALVLSR